ncbi:hypothetical protein MTO96_008803 [Rhipicephalus appendiculatus]
MGPVHILEQPHLIWGREMPLARTPLCQAAESDVSDDSPVAALDMSLAASRPSPSPPAVPKPDALVVPPAGVQRRGRHERGQPDGRRPPQEVAAAHTGRVQGRGLLGAPQAEQRVRQALPGAATHQGTADGAAGPLPGTGEPAAAHRAHHAAQRGGQAQAAPLRRQAPQLTRRPPPLAGLLNQWARPSPTDPGRPISRAAASSIDEDDGGGGVRRRRTRRPYLSRGPPVLIRLVDDEGCCLSSPSCVVSRQPYSSKCTHSLFSLSLLDSIVTVEDQASLWGGGRTAQSHRTLPMKKLSSKGGRRELVPISLARFRLPAKAVITPF